jgi:hypothetical protein
MSAGASFDALRLLRMLCAQRKTLILSKRPTGPRVEGRTILAPDPCRILLRQQMEQIKIAADQRFLLRTIPSLDLPFSRDRVHQSLEILLPDQDNRAARRRVSAEAPGIVLPDAVV